jgi:hypothetical protein
VRLSLVAIDLGLCGRRDRVLRRGGYANTDRLAHKLQKDANGDYPRTPVATRSQQDPELEFDLEYCDQDNAGFLCVTVTAEKLTIDSFSVPFDGGFEDTVRDIVSVARDGRMSAPSAHRPRRH